MKLTFRYALTFYFVTVATVNAADPCAVLDNFKSATGDIGEPLPAAEAGTWAAALVTAADESPQSPCASVARSTAVMLHSAHRRWDEAIVISDSGLALASPGPERVQFANSSIALRVRRAGGMQTPAIAAECAPIAQVGLEGYSHVADLIAQRKFAEIAWVMPLHHVIASNQGSISELLRLARECAAANDAAHAVGDAEPVTFDLFSLVREVLLLRLADPSNPSDPSLIECIDLVRWDVPSANKGILATSLLGVRRLSPDRRLRLGQLVLNTAPNEGWRMSISQAMLTARLSSGVPADNDAKIALFSLAESVRVQAEAIAITLEPGAAPSGFDHRHEWDAARRAAHLQAAELGLGMLRRCDLGVVPAQSFLALYPDDDQAAHIRYLLTKCP